MDVNSQLRTYRNLCCTWYDAYVPLRHFTDCQDGAANGAGPSECTAGVLMLHFACREATDRAIIVIAWSLARCEWFLACLILLVIDAAVTEIRRYFAAW